MKIFPGYINLLKTAIGSGILAYPYLFKVYGVIPVIVFSCLAAFFSTFGLVFYIIVNDYYGVSNSLTSLAANMFPGSKKLADAAICFKCFGVAISYLIIIREILPVIVEHFTYAGSTLSKPWLALLIFTVTVSSLTFFKNLQYLKFTSFLGISCIIIVIVSTVDKFGRSGLSVDINYFGSPDKTWLTGIGKFVFAFTCHQNIFTVHHESGASRTQMIRLAVWTNLTALVVYCTFGLLNYAVYADRIQDNILTVYDRQGAGIFLRSLYVVVMGVSYPLQVYPCRFYLLSLCGLLRKASNKLQALVTVLILGLTYAVAATGINLGTVYSIIGATVGTFMVLIMPAVFFMRIAADKNRCMMIVSYASIVLGIMTFISVLANCL